MTDDLLAEPLQIVDGVLATREQPGYGAELDPDKLAHYRVDG
jgi:L-alanine-DL-glutamate epimerase-like enolase superfamily enzyme